MSVSPNSTTTPLPATGETALDTFSTLCLRVLVNVTAPGTVTTPPAGTTEVSFQFGVDRSVTVQAEPGRDLTGRLRAGRELAPTAIVKLWS